MIDFRNDASTPRSGRQRMGRFLWLLRVSDKARAARAGTLGEYVYGCPIDRGMTQRWGISLDEFDAAIERHTDDPSLYEWLRARTGDAAIDDANDWLVATWTENLDRQDREERGRALGIATPVCTNCGVAFPPSVPLPERCTICDDERVSHPANQRWTLDDELAATHVCELRELEPGMTGIGVTPAFAIDQRAILIEHGDGCILWDCLPLVDRNAIDYIRSRGGLKAIAVSHPHFYGAMARWSQVFGEVPVYVHEADRDWVVHAPRSIVFWRDDINVIAPGVTLVRTGGHFEGATVMHVASASNGRGALLTGDSIMVTQYGGGVAFMRSYPGYVPLRAAQLRAMQASLAPFSFETLYGCWWDRTIASGGDALVARTLHRHIELLQRA